MMESIFLACITAGIDVSTMHKGSLTGGREETNTARAHLVQHALTEKKEQMSALLTAKGMPRSLIQPSWKGTVAGSSTGAMLGFTMPPVAGLSAAMPLMPAGSGAGPPA